MHAGMQACVRAPIHMHDDVSECSYVYACVRVCTHVYVYMRMWTSMHACVRVRTRVYAYLRMSAVITTSAVVSQRLKKHEFY